MSRASRRASAGRRPSRSFESSPIPSASRPPPIRSADTCRSPAACMRIWASVSSSTSNSSCGRVAARGESAAILREALPGHGAQEPPLEIAPAVERIDEVTRLEPSRHRVDGEVTPCHVVLDRDRRVGHDLEVAVAGPNAPLPSWRRELDPCRRGGADARVPWLEADAHELPVHLHVVDAPVRLECGPSPAWSRPGTRKSSSACSIPSSSSRTAPPTTYASRPSERT